MIRRQAILALLLLAMVPGVTEAKPKNAQVDAHIGFFTSNQATCRQKFENWWRAKPGAKRGRGYREAVCKKGRCKRAIVWRDSFCSFMSKAAKATGPKRAKNYTDSLKRFRLFCKARNGAIRKFTKGDAKRRFVFSANNRTCSRARRALRIREGIICVLDPNARRTYYFSRPCSIGRLVRWSIRNNQSGWLTYGGKKRSRPPKRRRPRHKKTINATVECNNGLPADPDSDVDCIVDGAPRGSIKIWRIASGPRKRGGNKKKVRVTNSTPRHRKIPVVVVVKKRGYRPRRLKTTIIVKPKPDVPPPPPVPRETIIVTKKPKPRIKCNPRTETCENTNPKPGATRKWKRRLLDSDNDGVQDFGDGKRKENYRTGLTPKKKQRIEIWMNECTDVLQKDCQDSNKEIVEIGPRPSWTFKVVTKDICTGKLLGGNLDTFKVTPLKKGVCKVKLLVNAWYKIGIHWNGPSTVGHREVSLSNLPREWMSDGDPNRTKGATILVKFKTDKVRTQRYGNAQVRFDGNDNRSANLEIVPLISDDNGPRDGFGITGGNVGVYLLQHANSLVVEEGPRLVGGIGGVIGDFMWYRYTRKALKLRFGSGAALSFAKDGFSGTAVTDSDSSVITSLSFDAFRGVLIASLFVLRASAGINIPFTDDRTVSNERNSVWRGTPLGGYGMLEAGIHFEPNPKFMLEVAARAEVIGSSNGVVASLPGIFARANILDPYIRLQVGFRYTMQRTVTIFSVAGENNQSIPIDSNRLSFHAMAGSAIPLGKAGFLMINVFLNYATGNKDQYIGRVLMVGGSLTVRFGERSNLPELAIIEGYHAMPASNYRDVTIQDRDGNDRPLAQSLVASRRRQSPFSKALRMLLYRPVLHKTLKRPRILNMFPS